MPTDLSFAVSGRGSRTISIETAVIAGWTGRDRVAVEHHIAELAALGIAPPSEVPLFYRVSASLFIQSQVIEVVGTDTSGEAEPVLIDDGSELYLGLGSDHTDRALEVHSVAHSKQACPKPLASTLWRYAAVAEHLDRVELRSWIREDAGREWALYQEGSLAGIQPLDALIARAPIGEPPGRLRSGTAMMCGTLGAIGGIRPARHIRLEMSDPVLGQSIIHEYEALALPNIA
jgi:hypothetical protein